MHNAHICVCVCVYAGVRVCMHEYVSEFMNVCM